MSESFNNIPKNPENTFYTVEQAKQVFSWVVEKAKKDNIYKLCANPVIIKDNKVLIFQRPATSPNRPNGWLLPGGKVEEGENVVDALVRETKEELNLDVVKIRHLPIEFDSIFKGNLWRVVYFVVEITGEMKLEERALSNPTFISKPEIPNYFTQAEMDPSSPDYRGGELSVWDYV